MAQLERIGATMEQRQGEKRESKNKEENGDEEEGSKDNSRESQEERILSFTFCQQLFFNNILLILYVI